MFLYDILQQRGWSPADDLGRIKLIISEGFPRGSVTVPVERVKNVAAFAFQHAPLCMLGPTTGSDTKLTWFFTAILEAAGLAWPSPSLWLHSPVPSSKPVPTFSSNDGHLLHGHSPRRPKHKRAAANERGLGSGIPSQGDQIWSGIESHPGAASRSGLALNAGQAGRTRRAYRTPPPPLDWMHHTAQNEQPPYIQEPGENAAGQQNSTSDTSMPDYLGIPQDGQGSWSYFNPKCQSNDFMGSESNGFLPTMFNKVPANTPASTSTDNSSTPGKRNPYLRHNALGSQSRVPATGFVNMMHQPTMGQPVNTPNLARNIPLPPSLSSSAVGHRACAHIQDGELMCSDPSCHRTPQSMKGGFMGHRIFSQPFMDAGMEGRSSSLIHFGAGGPGLGDVEPDPRTDSGGTSSGCGSNQTGSGGADVGINRLSLDSSNVAPAQGQGHAPGSKVLSSNPVDSVELTDEAIMQALAQA